MVSKKTEPMFLGVRPNAPNQGRRTDLMGLPAIEEPAFRDTIKDPGTPFEELIPTPPPPEAGAQPQASPLPRGGTMPVSARIESLQAPVPLLRQPLPVGGRVDVSKADPRRAPTQRVAKRPNEMLEPDWSVAHKAPPRYPYPQPAVRRESPIFLWALALFGLLAAVLGAVVVYLRVLR